MADAILKAGIDCLKELGDVAEQIYTGRAQKTAERYSGVENFCTRHRHDGTGKAWQIFSEWTKNNLQDKLQKVRGTGKPLLVRRLCPACLFAGGY